MNVASSKSAPNKVRVREEGRGFREEGRGKRV
jgi:hypothetical protein